MKRIKTRTVLKNIKKIDRAAHLSNRIRSRAAHRTKEQNAPTSAEGYAQEKVTDSVAAVARKGRQAVVAVSKVSPSRQNKAKSERARNGRRASTPFNRPSFPNSNQTGETLKGMHRATSGKQATKLAPASNPHPLPQPGQTSPSPTCANRTFRLKKPHRGRYVLPSIERSGQPRWIPSHVKARVPQRSPSTSTRSYWPGDSPSLSSRSLAKRLAERQAKRNVSYRHRLSIPSSPTMTQASPSERTPLRKISELAKPDKLMNRSSQPVKSVKKPRTAAARPIQQVLYRRRMMQYARVGKRSMRHVGIATRFTFRLAAMAAKAAALLLKSLLPLLGASSSVLIVLLVVAMAVAIISSPFGIFVSGENKDQHATSVEKIVHELNAEFDARLKEIERSHGHVDRVEIHYAGSANNTRVDNWSDILAVFAVKTTMDDENGMDVATLDATRVHLLETTFWDMNLIDTDIEPVEHTETTTVVHEDGSTSEETDTVTEYTLHVTVTCKTAEQQADSYGFTDEQKELMEEMMSGEFRPLMKELLGKYLSNGLKNVHYALQVDELGNDAVKLVLNWRW